jgi:hypothetical protein
VSGWGNGGGEHDTAWVSTALSGITVACMGPAGGRRHNLTWQPLLDGGFIKPSATTWRDILDMACANPAAGSEGMGHHCVRCFDGHEQTSSSAPFPPHLQHIPPLGSSPATSLNSTPG